MTAAKIAITLPEEQLRLVKNAVKRGRAASVSEYIQRALSEQNREESLEVLVHDLVARFGEPTKADEAWARRALGKRPRKK